MSFFGLTINLLSHFDAMGYSCTKPLNSFPTASFSFQLPFSVRCYKRIGPPLENCFNGAQTMHSLRTTYSEIVAPIDTLDTPP